MQTHPLHTSDRWDCEVDSSDKTSNVKIHRKFTVVIERDEDGYYVGTVPTLRGCHTQAKTLDLLMKRVREAVALCLESDDGASRSLELVGVQQISI